MENYKRKNDNSHWISIAAVTNYYQLNNTKLSHRSVGESHGGFSWFLYSKSHESRIKVFAIVGSYLEALGSNEGEVSFSLFVCLFVFWKSLFRLIHVLGTNQFHVGTLSFWLSALRSAQLLESPSQLVAPFIFKDSNNRSSPAHILTIFHFLF